VLLGGLKIKRLGGILLIIKERFLDYKKGSSQNESHIKKECLKHISNDIIDLMRRKSKFPDRVTANLYAEDLFNLKFSVQEISDACQNIALNARNFPSTQEIVETIRLKSHIKKNFLKAEKTESKQSALDRINFTKIKEQFDLLCPNKYESYLKWYCEKIEGVKNPDRLLSALYKREAMKYFSNNKEKFGGENG